MLPSARGLLYWVLAIGALAIGGCTSPREYLRNGFKVGPQYATPPAPVAEQWIDSNDVRLHAETDDLSTWWAVFDDPTLNDLMVDAYRQNLTLREAGFRILAARAQFGIAFGNFFPQLQTMDGSYQRRVIAANLQPAVDLRVQHGLGAGLLGPFPTRDHFGRRQSRRVRVQLRRHPGHAGGRTWPATMC